MNDELKPLSRKHQAFVDHWLSCFNGTEAYLKVYPKVGRDTARANAAKLLATANIAAEVQSRLNEAHMSADEALKLNADIARGDLTEFIDGFGSFDINALKKSGKGRLVRKLKQRTTITSKNGEDREYTETEFEFYPADVAIDRVLKVHGKYLERVDMTSNGETLKPEEMKPSEIAARVAALLKNTNVSNG